LSADVDAIRARVRPACTEQGVPEKVEDPAIIANVVALAFEGLTTGHVVRADGFGRWQEHDREVDFFLEYDCGTEPLDRLAAYHEPADITEIPTLVPFWLPSSGREVSVREALATEQRWARVRFVVATASPTLALGPAEGAWLPLRGTWPRRLLVELDDEGG